jgi:phage/plasmid-like protein (TIGR03299 family)
MPGFTTFTEAVPPEQALVDAGLDWTVEKQHLYTSTQIKVRSQMGVVRSDTNEVIGIVGNERGMIQNREHVEFVQALTDQLGANVVAAGSLYHGASVFFALALTEPTLLHGEYRIDHTAISASSHDSTRSLSLRLMSTALLCTNQLSGTGADIKIRHSKNVHQRLQAAVQAESVLRLRVQRLEQKLEARIDTPFTENEFWRFVESQFPFTAGKQELPVLEKRDKLMSIYRSGTQEPFRGTLFAATSAVEEYFDWSYGSDESRAKRQLLRLNEADKTKMLRTLAVAAS